MDFRIIERFPTMSCDHTQNLKTTVPTVFRILGESFLLLFPGASTGRHPINGNGLHHHVHSTTDTILHGVRYGQPPPTWGVHPFPER